MDDLDGFPVFSWRVMADQISVSPREQAADGRKRPSAGGLPARWMLLLGGMILTAGVLAAIAGAQAENVFGTLEYGAFLLLLFLPAWMLGIFLTVPFARRNCFAASPWPAGYRSLVAVGLGLGAIAILTLLFGAVHLIEPGGNVWAIFVIPAAAVLIGAAPTRNFVHQLRDGGPGFLRQRARRGDWLLLLAAPPAAILLIAACFPPNALWSPNGYDVLEYHLELPREYALLNSTAPLRHNVYSFLPANVEMLYLYLMQVSKALLGATDADTAYVWATYPAQFCHAMLMVLSAAAIALLPFRETDADKPFLQSTGRAIAAVVFFGVPWTLITGSMAFNEGGMFFFGTLALGLALGGTQAAKNGGVSADHAGAKDAEKWNGLLIGILLGLAVGCKMTAGVFFAIPVAVILIVRAVSRSSGWTALVIAVIAACVVYAPWAARAAAHSGGNPVFPIAASVLPRDSWSKSQVERFNEGHSAPAEAGQTTWMEKMDQRGRALADNSIFDPDWSMQPFALLHVADNPQPAADTWWKRLGLLWWAAPLAFFCAFISRSGRGQTGLIAGIMVIQAAAWMFVTHLQARFLLPAAVPLAILMGRGVQGLNFAAEGIPASAVRILAGTIIGVEALATGFLLLPEAHLLGGVAALNSPANHPPPAPPIGELFERVVNAAALAANPAGTQPDRPVPPEKVFLLGAATAWTFVGPVDYRTVFDTNPLLEHLAAGDPQGALEWLKKDGAKLLWVDWMELARLERTYHLELGLPPRKPEETDPDRAGEIMMAYGSSLKRAGIEDTHGSPVPWATLYRVPAGQQ